MDRQTNRLHWRQPGTQKQVGWNIGCFFPILPFKKKNAIEHNLKKKNFFWESIVSKYILFKHY